MKKTGLFFGSFNPIHNGHLIIANYFREYTDLDELWFVVSPQNPLKPRSTLLADYHRLEMVRLAIEDVEPRYRASDIEFRMPKPSYTIDTLVYLSEKYPQRQFVLIMGGDNLVTFHKWKNYQRILDEYEIYVYPRPGYDLGKYSGHPKVKLWNAPLMEISSSFIRQAIKEGKDVRFYLHQKVYEYLDRMNFYR